MCGPLALGLAQFAIGAATSVASYSAQNAESKATEKAAMSDWRNKQNATSLREMQEQNALRQKQTQQNIEEAQVRAETETSAAASGVSGISLDNLLADVSRRAATNRSVEEENTNMTLQQLEASRKGITSEAQGRINSAPRPSPLSLIAGIGSAGISGYSSYMTQKNRIA